MVQNHLPHDHGQTIEQELEHISKGSMNTEKALFQNG